MTIASATAVARANLARLSGWGLRRARERSTWLGLAAVAAALGRPVWAAHLTSLGDAMPILLGAGGAALAAASTSAHPTPQP